MLLLGSLSLFLIACSTNDDPSKASYWIERLEDKNQRIEALKELGKIGDKTALPQVTHWFEESGLWQPEAAYSLGLLGDKNTSLILITGIDYSVGTGTDKRTRAKNRTNLNTHLSILLHLLLAFS